jgi:hypothetical protein
MATVSEVLVLLNGARKKYVRHARQSIEIESLALAEDRSEMLLWDIISALRGPDDRICTSRADDIKIYTTARIRGILGIEGDDQGLTIRNLPLSDAEIKVRNEFLDEASLAHFASHFKRAMNALKAFQFDVPEGELDFRF